MNASTTFSLIRGASLRAQPWKNGGGVTREIAAYPEGASMDAFAWRVSVAEVAQSGPFSRFEGVDRTLVLLEGAGMMLDEGERKHALLQPLDAARFAGESGIDARLVEGATRDFNLMVRRDTARGTLDVWRDNATHDVRAHTVLLYCARGALSVVADDGESVTLASGDTLRVDTTPAHAMRIVTHGDGALLAVALTLAVEETR